MFIVHNDECELWPFFGSYRAYGVNTGEIVVACSTRMCKTQIKYIF